MNKNCRNAPPRIRSTFRLAWLVVGFLSTASSLEAAELPPNGTLQVAYRQFEDGKLGDSVHHVTLACWDGSCSLTTLSLNQCMSGAFYPKVQRSATGERGFSVSESEPGVLHVAQWLLDTNMTYEFRYLTEDLPEFSRSIGLRGTRWFKTLTGFSGAATKHSVILNKVIAWTFVPLKGKSPRIKAACDIMLDGVPE